jgi:hypothetical protein
LKDHPSDPNYLHGDDDGVRELSLESLRACLVKVRVRMILYAFSYEKPYSISPIPSGLVYDPLREDGIEVESLDESQATPHADLLEDV